MSKFFSVICVLFGAQVIFCDNFQQPEQIHLAYGDGPTSMVVVWSTMNATKDTTAMIGSGDSRIPLKLAVKGTSKMFVDFGVDQHTQYIHRVKFTQLKPGAPYRYKVGSEQDNIWSQEFTFRAMKDGSNWSPSFAVYGDFGFSNHQSLQRLLMDNQKEMYDAILHVGDFAYDLNTDNGRVGDKFMNMIQPLAANLPYMTCPGNHEGAYNFSQYKNRFSMPNDDNMEKMFYSFNMGPVHFISLSTEFYFFWQFGVVQIDRQYNWLKKDLEEANKPENRAKQPWIIAMGHRPMYCSNNDKDDCTKHHSLVRDGIPFIHIFGLESLFHEYGVDLAIWAHEHSYERLWPLYQDKVYNGSYQQPYTNPKAPVHIITGSAGCQENHDPFVPDPRPWSAFRSTDYGYTRMKVLNSTHLYLEQVSDDKGGAIIDKLMLIQNKHGSFTDKA